MTKNLCQELLKLELMTIKPKLVVGLGRHASSFFKKDLNLVKDNGIPIEVDFQAMKFKFIPCYHPAACLYRRQLTKQFQKTFKTIKEIIDNNG